MWMNAGMWPRRQPVRARSPALGYTGRMANENNPTADDLRQPVHEDRQAAAQAAEEEAQEANITAVGAVMYSAPEGYGTGDGATWPPQ